MRIDHINVRGPEGLIEKVEKFYCDLFGMETGPRPDFGTDGSWLYSGRKALIHLSISDEDPGPGSGGYLDHVAFQAQGLEAYIGKIESHGLPYRTNFIPELEMTQVFFTDPAGNGIEINFPGERLQ